jgi:hypothetical protein
MLHAVSIFNFIKIRHPHLFTLKCGVLKDTRLIQTRTQCPQRAYLFIS